MHYGPLNQLGKLVKSHSIDIFICSASFEDRCFSTATHVKNEKFKYTIVLFNSNEDDVIVDNAYKLEKLFPFKTTLVSLNSDEPIINFSKIYDVLEFLLLENISYKFLIDSTTFTHETLLILIKSFELIRGDLNNIYISYVGASDYSFNTKDDNLKWLSKGIKEIRTVLGYPGYIDPTKKNHLIVLFGFESERTRMLIDSYEFNVVSLGFAERSGSIQDNHQKINAQRHNDMLIDYPNAFKFTFSCISPFETKKAILERVEQFKNYNTVVAPMNNKISTLGVGLAAMENFDIQITYAKPNIYNSEAYSMPNDKVHFFELIEYPSNKPEDVTFFIINNQLPDFSKIELKILHALSLGMSRMEIIRELGIRSNSTYDTHIHHIKRKIGTFSMNDIAQKAVELGYL